MRRPTAAIDFDGVLATYDSYKGPNDLGAPIREALELITELHAAGWTLILYTTRLNPDPFCRGEDRHAEAEQNRRSLTTWLEHYGIRDLFTHMTALKPVADIYLDDRALSFKPDAEGLRLCRAVFRLIEQKIKAEER